MPKSNSFCTKDAKKKNKTSHHEQTKSFDKNGSDRTETLTERSVSYAEGKQKLEKQDERQVSFPLHDVKTKLKLAIGKQSVKNIIVDSNHTTPIAPNNANGETPEEREGNGSTSPSSSTDVPFFQKLGGRKIYCPAEGTTPNITPANKPTTKFGRVRRKSDEN